MAIEVKYSPLVFQKAQTPSSYINYFTGYKDSGSQDSSSSFPVSFFYNMFGAYTVNYFRACITTTPATIWPYLTNDDPHELTINGYVSNLNFQCLDFFKYSFTYTNQNYYNEDLSILGYMSCVPNTFIIWFNGLFGSSIDDKGMQSYQNILSSVVNNIDASTGTPLPIKGKLKSIYFYPFIQVPNENGSLWLSHHFLNYLNKHKSDSNVTNSILSYILQQLLEGGTNEGGISVKDPTVGILYNFEWNNNTEFTFEY